MDAANTAAINVLLVEDVTADAELVERVLTRGGLQVQVKRVVSEADLRSALREQPWDIVLTDFRLPGLDGLDVLRVLREERIGTPCILVSGTIGDATAVKVMREGAKDFILKDSLARLPEVVRREIDQAASRARNLRLEQVQSALRDVAREIGRLLDPTSSAQLVITKAQELLQVDIAALYWWNEQRSVLELLAESGTGGTRVETIPVGQGVSGVAFQQRAPVRVDDYARWSPQLIPVTGSALAVPALVGDRVVGTLYVRSIALRKFTDDDAQALQLFASQVAPAIEVSRLLLALRASEGRFATAFHQNPVGIIATTRDDRTILDVNESFLQLIGYRREELLGRPATEFGLIAPQQRDALRAAFQEGRSSAGVEIEIRGRQGETHNVIVYSEPIDLAEGPAVLSSVIDLTARRSAERMLRHNSLHDELTGLPNRAFLYEQLHSLMTVQPPPESRVALLLVDLDGFGAANDEFSHHGGDLLLTQVARRLGETVDATDVLARVGGDEFAVLATGAGAINSAQLARRLLAGLDAPFIVGNQRVPMGASIGIGLFPDHATTADDLMRCAAVALQRAKRIGGSSMTYESGPPPAVPTSLGLLGEFRDAMEGGDLVLFYQPQFELRTRRRVGAEALLRWQHPKRGLLSPISFLPMVARTNLMQPLLHWVLRTALAQTRSLGLHVAVNLAMRNLLEPGLKELVVSALNEAGRSPSDLTLEITEDAVMSNPETAGRALDELAELGCRLSIDDFGTGYSSMAYLQRLSTHELKIDRSFVTGIPEETRNASIVEASVALAHGLGLTVVAEGVEVEANVAALIKFNCDRAQGYLLGRPGPLHNLVRASA